MHKHYFVVVVIVEYIYMCVLIFKGHLSTHSISIIYFYKLTKLWFQCLGFLTKTTTTKTKKKLYNLFIYFVCASACYLFVVVWEDFKKKKIHIYLTIIMKERRGEEKLKYYKK